MHADGMTIQKGEDAEEIKSKQGTNPNVFPITA